MKYSRNLFDAAAMRTELFGEAGPGMSLVEIVGQKRVLIENHIGITDYSDCCICVKTKSGCISISGQDLLLAHMSRQKLVVTGMIECVSLKRGDVRENVRNN